MEPLLNISDAAAFLNVSEMTIRRWTNKGILPCYRVGGRRSRRFDRKDLQHFVGGKLQSSKAGDVSIGYKGFVVPDGAHITHLSLDASEALDVASSYILEGLVTGESVWVVAPPLETERIFSALRKRHIDPETLGENGLLGFNEGMSMPKQQFQSLAEKALAHNKRFRVFGDMRWTKAKNWSSVALRELEESIGVNAMYTGVLFLCQYALASFCGEDAMMALETHSHSIYRGELKKNPYRN